MSDSFSYHSIPEITVEELGHRLQAGSETLQLVDVREPEEVEIAEVEGFINLPLSEFNQWSDQIHSHLDLEKETLVMCHHGMRSAQMCYWLMRQGFTNVKNIRGGIDAYSVLVDSDIPRY
ncbi:MAG: rhodanese-like domain-containing protein [Cyanobacteriota bacterium]|nr:rhodanese-like domain-containing protein [Cyanobacteriota bacterium]